MPHAPGGILPPLGALIVQRKVVPCDVGHRSEKAEATNPSSTSDASFDKSLHRTEVQLRNHLVPVVKRSPSHLSGGGNFHDHDNEDDVVLASHCLPSAGVPVPQVEHGLSGLHHCLVIQHDSGANTLKGFFKQSSTEPPVGEFYHHPVYASVAQNGSWLHALTLQQHYLNLAKDYTMRLKGAWAFTQRLSDILVALVPASLVQTGTLKVLCEELRTHTGHWRVLQRRIRRDHCLRPLLLHKQNTFAQMRRTLSRLACQATQLIELCINSILQSLAHASAPSFSSEELTDVFRAVEIYNQVVSESSAVWLLPDCQLSADVPESAPGPNSTLQRWHAQRRPGTYPIARVLSIISEERGQQAAERFHQSLLQQEEFLHRVSRSSLCSVDWKNAKVPLFGNISSSVTGTKQIRPLLSSPKIRLCQPACSHLSASRLMEAICAEDDQLMESILDVLVSSTDTFWHHFLKKPKLERPQSAKAHPMLQPSQDENELLAADGDLDVIHAEEKLHIYGSLDSTHRLRTPRPDAVGVLHTRYRTLLWKKFMSCFFDGLYAHPGTAPCEGCLCLLKEGASMAVALSVEDMMKDASVPEECVVGSWNLCLHLLTRTALIGWDHGFCRALGSGLNDKCVPDSSRGDELVRSRTAGLLLDLFPALGFVLESLHTRKMQCSVVDPVLPSLQLAVLSRCLATLQSVCSWVMTKAYQFLSSWSINQFLLVTQADLVLLTAETEKMIALVREACPEDMEVPAVRGSGTSQQVAKLCLQIQTAAASLQRFSSEVLQLFSDDCRRMSADLFLQKMPAAKHWRPRLQTDVPNEPSEYATAAVQIVVGQALQGIQPLPQESQIAALTHVLGVFMEAWMDHILHHKIRFSLQGALQLKQDFDMVRHVIQSQDSNLSQDVRQAVLSHRVFQHADNAIICLLQQPTSKTYMPSEAWHPFRNCCACNHHEDFNSGSLNSLESLDIQTVRNGTVLEAHSSATADLLSKMRSSSNPESYLMVNQQGWLSLRLHRGRRWRMPGLSCVSRTPEP
ncbi:hypothetical protein NDU88_007363 [Pleurodeles waltl]|uniref:Coiled-coil protein 142 C-terminal domain-containing protein n=2 Tax=Pleurodeles waltl TaxID=8319 RepID=A0AAV7WDB9_PLEWA|nr:hypothetical protein NDU88_007363 [Pleurodeles waltl]